MTSNCRAARSLGGNSAEHELLAPATDEANEEGHDDEAAAPSVTDEQGEDEIIIEDGQEVEPLKSAPAPTRPSAAEVEEHRITHTPYRTWCDECRQGRGLGEQRGRHKGRQHDIPRIGVDYWYITPAGMMTRKDLPQPQTADGNAAVEEERREQRLMKCLIVRCHESKAVFAHCVPCKGDDEDKYVTSLIVSDVAFMGHVRLILKTDNEVALLALVRAALEEIRCNVSSIERAMSEESAPYDSQSNGGTECGIREVRGLFRTIKLDTEKRIGRAIPACHPICSWLVEHAALLITAMRVGTDGKTAWSRLRGRGFGQRMVGFGESVLYKQPPKGPQHDPQGNMGPRMHIGTFLGFHKTSNAYRVMATDGSIVKSRGLSRRCLADRWQAETLQAVQATPWSLRAPADAVRIPLGEQVAPHPSEADGPLVARRLKITRKTLHEHGTTDGCPQCSHLRAFGESKPGLQHSEKCRQRLMEALNGTAEGASRLERYEERIDRAIASHHDSSLGPTQVPPGASGVRGAMGVPSDEAAAETPVVNTTATSNRATSSRPLAPPDTDMGAGNGYEEVSDDDDENMMTAVNDRVDEMTMSIGELKKRIEDAQQHVKRIEEREAGDVVQVLALLGADPRSYRREQKQAVRRIVSEVYSPPRITEMLKGMSNQGLTPGLALDITTIDPADGEPWDFTVKSKRQRALKLIREQRPLFLIGSPMCTRYSTWQFLNDSKRDPGTVARERRQADKHLEFVAQLYREQIEGGRFFLHEHPEHATSWEVEAIKSILEIPGVDWVGADQCVYGQEVQHGQHRGQPVKKPTGFMSNAPMLLKRLKSRCTGGKHPGACSRVKGGTHQPCSGRVAKDAAKYSKGLCRAIIHGMVDEMHFRGILRRGEQGMHAVTDEDMQQPWPEGCSGKFRDDISGQLLRDDLVAEARAKELQYFCDKGVWTKRPRREAKSTTGRDAISVRWVDVNKGDDQNPRYRSRLVARQLKAHDRSSTSFFAPTPPLEALRTVLSLAATSVGDWKPCYHPASEHRTQLLCMDISRAYFNAKIDPGVHTYVQLPEEDKDCGHMCAKLMRHMYGTRAAADGWQEEYSTFLVEELKFRQGISSPCLFKHPTRQLVSTVHGDDFTTVGRKSDLDWFEREMRKHYELTAQPRLGPGPQDASECVVLNRVIRWTPAGLEYEADPRQVEKLVSECGMTDTNSVATPGVRVAFSELENDPELQTRHHTAFRGAAARANYLAADRPDCQFAAKEVCRWMSKPTEAAWSALKRLCRYLVGLPRMIFKYAWQDISDVDIYTDTDWAGCPRTRKSTSGGCVMLGTHLIKSWSSTQTSVALSSGEAEFNGVVRGSGIGLGFQSLLSDLGVQVPLRVWTDSSAAIGICSRQGLGKLRHLDTHTLWIQQAVRSKRVDLRKIPGERNPADLFTKHSLTREKLMQLTGLFDCRFSGGRAAAAPQTRTTAGIKGTLAEVHALEECTPIMPHRVYEREALDELYPPLAVADAVDDEEDEVDPVLAHGMEIVEDIVDRAVNFGRRRLQK